MDFTRPSPPSTAGLALRDAGMLLLRWCAGVTLISFHTWEEGVQGWKHVWQKEPWAWAVEVTERGFPLPELVAAASVAVAMLASVFLITGLLCRLSAAVLLGCALCGIFIYGQVPEISERLSLYAGIYAVLVLCGPGRLSLDALFTARKSAGR